MAITKNQKEINEILIRGVEKIYPSREALETLLKKRRIRVYQGFDPSMSSLHLGNLVGILKLKQFQNLGHEVIFLIGDFTGMIGDPTDKAAARKKLSREEVIRNTKQWKEQIGRFLNFSGKNPVKILFNSSWLDKIHFKDIIEITSCLTVQQMIERDFFQKRIKKKKPIFLHEFLYPVAQGLDSVKMDVDLEIGGSDQTFNMLVGRDLMKALKNKEKFVLTMKLLVGKEGKKVGKTTGGAIFLSNPPDEMFGQIMALPDEVIVSGFELLTEIPRERIKEFQSGLDKEMVNPRDLKKELAFEVVKGNYGKDSAQKALEEFKRVFTEKKLPNTIQEIRITEKNFGVLDLLVKTKIASSKSEAKRLIFQKGVKINGKIQENWRAVVPVQKGMIIQAGKRRFRKII